MVALQKPSGRYVAAFDGLRGLAIALVVCHNAAPRADHAGLVERVYLTFAEAGWAGVQLFFVLSGFLITGILIDTKDNPHYFRNFYVRRSLRIFPVYYFVLALVLLVGPLVFGTASAGVRWILGHQAWQWTYTANIAVLHYNRWSFNADWIGLDHTWSLAVEEQFYLVWPWLVFALGARGRTIAAWAIIAAAPILRVVLLWRGHSPEAVYAFTPCRLDALAAGTLLAGLVRTETTSAHRLRLAARMMQAGALPLVATIAVTHGFRSEDRYVQSYGYSCLALLCAGIVLWAVSTPPDSRSSRFLTHPVLTFIGRYSYGLYLFHGILMPLDGQLPVEGLARAVHSHLAAALINTAIVMAVATAVAFASWHLIERRFLAYKDRFTR
jgi:peptidoglycan/LPS O-acetylase OafA/YrhL